MIDKKGKVLALIFFFFFFPILSLESSELFSLFLDAGRCNNQKDAELLVAFGPHLGYPENQ